MSYTWTDGELITAEKLNQMGSNLILEITTESITENGNNGTKKTLNATYNQLKNVLDSGNFIVRRYPVEDVPDGVEVTPPCYYIDGFSLYHLMTAGALGEYPVGYYFFAPISDWDAPFYAESPNEIMTSIQMENTGGETQYE